MESLSLTPGSLAFAVSEAGVLQADAPGAVTSAEGWLFRVGALDLFSSSGEIATSAPDPTALVVSAGYRVVDPLVLSAWASSSTWQGARERLGIEAEVRPLTAQLSDVPRSAQLGGFLGLNAAGTVYFGPRFLLNILPKVGVGVAVWNPINGGASRIETGVEFRI